MILGNLQVGWKEVREIGLVSGGRVCDGGTGGISGGDVSIDDNCG